MRADPQSVDPVKFFVAILYQRPEALDRARRALQALFGDIDNEGPDHTFDVTDYYEPEMGAGLKRRLVAFEPLVEPERLIQAKLETNALEERLGQTHGRLVNLDVGYLDHHKVVLASVKGAGQKVYLGQGVWADLVCRYHKGSFAMFEWSFPDFRDGRYDAQLLTMRADYLQQLRSLRKAAL